MSSVDQRVVEMKFNNSAFAKGIQDTLTALGNLQKGLKLEGATKGAQDASAGLDGLGKKTGGIGGLFTTLGATITGALGLTRKSADDAGLGVAGIGTKASSSFGQVTQGAADAGTGIGQLGAQTGFLGGQFTAMQALAFGALASIGAQAVQTGLQVAKSLTIAPIMQGFQEYETNMNSIQTILANTSAAGTGLPEVNAALDEMNHYSDKTIYNFAEMAKNVGTFTAAGVDLDTATGSIKGIANLAALSGSNSQQAAGAMYQLSQEIAAGKVTLMGWNSVVNAGMGGSVFQRALAETAVAMGKIDKSALTLEGDMKNVKISGQSFRDSISAENGESWLSSDVLTSTLQQFTGDMSDAELAAQGFSAAQIEAIKQQANMAVGAATEVKTLTGLMDTLKEGVASGWSQSFRILVGDFEEAKQLFTGISNSVGGWLGGMSDARNELLGGWKDLGGRTALLDGLTLGLRSIFAMLKPIGEAFRSIFPPMTAQHLLDITLAFNKFAGEVTPSEKTIDNIRRTFAGLFAVLGIGWEIIKAAAGAIFDLFGSFSGAGGGILGVTANIGDFLVALHEAIKSGDVFGKIFDGLGSAVQVVIGAFSAVINWIKSFTDGIDGIDSGAFSGIFDPMAEAGDRIGGVFERIGDVLSTVGNAIGDFVGNAIDWFSKLGEVFEGNGWEFNADTIMQALGVGLGAGFLLVLNKLKNVIGNFNLFSGAGGGFLESIQDVLGGVTDTLSAMQANLKANALLKIAAAIAILAAAVFVLAGIDSEGLVRATSALTVMFVQLGAAMAVFAKIGTVAQMAKITIMGFALIFLATAILILTAAVKKLSELDWNELAKGLVGVTVLVGALAAAAQAMSGTSGAMLRTGAALMLLAIAVRILVGAVEDLAALSWQELAKGLVGVGVLLGALALFTKFADADKGGLSQGLGLLLLAAALKVLASAVGDFASYSWEELGKGMAGIAVGLGLIAGALQLMPKSSLLNAAAILIVAASLGMIADAVGKMAGLSWEEVGRGMTVMAGALTAIAVALRLLPTGAIFSAAAIFVVAASLGMMADALKSMGSMSWEELSRGLVGLAGALGIIAIALHLMRGTIAGAAAIFVVAAALNVLLPVIQGFADMSWGELIQGLIGLAAVFAILGVAGLLLAPVSLVLLAVGAGILMLGAGVVLAAAGIVLFAGALTVLAAAGAAGAAALGLIITTLLGLLPLAAKMLGAAIVAFALIITEGAPAIIGAFVALLSALLQGIIDIAPLIGETITTLISTFLDVIIALTPKIVETMLVLLQALLTAITEAVPMMVEAGIAILLGFLQGIADNIFQVVTAATDIIVNLLNGIAANMPRIIQAGVNLIVSFLQGLSSAIPQIVEAGFQMIIDVVNGIADSIDENIPLLMEAAGNLAGAIIDGIVDGIGRLASKAWNAVTDLAGDLLDGAMDFLGIGGPSQAFENEVGKNIVRGIAVGVDKHGAMAVDSTLALGENLLDVMGKTISGLGDAVGGLDELNPVIAPVLDLSSVQRDASKIGALLGPAPLTLDGSASHARSASREYEANQLASAMEKLAKVSAPNVALTQNNYSPKALTSAEIYRQTNNQLSVAKGALTTK